MDFILCAEGKKHSNKQDIVSTVPKKRKLLFKQQPFTGSVVGGRRWVMEWKGMFSFRREENDLQIGGRNKTEVDKMAKSHALNDKFKY